MGRCSRPEQADRARRDGPPHQTISAKSLKKRRSPQKSETHPARGTGWWARQDSNLNQTVMSGTVFRGSHLKSARSKRD